MVYQNGQVAGHGIHDAVVRAFHFIMGDRFDICLRDPSGNDRVISLLGISAIGFRDVVSGTIVSDLFSWSLKAPPTTDESMHDAWRVLFAGNYSEHDFQGLVAKTQEQYAGQLLVFFESSYGGSIAAICRAIDGVRP